MKPKEPELTMIRNRFRREPMTGQTRRVVPVTGFSRPPEANLQLIESDRVPDRNLQPPVFTNVTPVRRAPLLPVLKRFRNQVRDQKALHRSRNLPAARNLPAHRVRFRRNLHPPIVDPLPSRARNLPRSPSPTQGASLPEAKRRNSFVNIDRFNSLTY